MRGACCCTYGGGTCPPCTKGHHHLCRTCTPKSAWMEASEKKRQGRGTSPRWFRKKRVAPATRASQQLPELPCDTWEGCYYQPHIASNRTGDGWHSHCLRCSERIVFLGYDGQGHWVVDPFVIEEEP